MCGYYTVEAPPPFQDRVGECYCPDCNMRFWPCDDYDVADLGCPDCGEEVRRMQDPYGLSPSESRKLRGKMLDYAIATGMSPWQVEELVMSTVGQFANKTADVWRGVAKQLSDAVGSEDEHTYHFTKGPWG